MFSGTIWESATKREFCRSVWCIDCNLQRFCKDDQRKSIQGLVQTHDRNFILRNLTLLNPVPDLQAKNRVLGQTDY